MDFSLAQVKSYVYAFVHKMKHSLTSGCTYGFERIVFMYHFFALHVNPFRLQLSYFLCIALLGSLLLMELKPSNPNFKPRYVDMLFMSASALTCSGLGTVEMENFSTSQIVVLTLWMFLGVDIVGIELETISDDQQITTDPTESGIDVEVPDISSTGGKDLRRSCMQYLAFVVLGYLLLIHLYGFLSIFLYLIIVSSSRDVLKAKGIHVVLFSASVAVSSFANGGLIPTNENIGIFGKNSGLLLLIVPQILAGNTLFPLFLRSVIWALRRITKVKEFEYMLRNPRKMRFDHLLPNLPTAFLSLTVVGFIAVMVTLLCSIDWNTAVFDGMNSYQKIIAALFMAVNSRHSGENSIDTGSISSAVLVLFIVMMYFPSSTSFLPIQEDDTSSLGKKNKTKKRSLAQYLILSQLSSIVVFVIAICISERRRVSRDPLNFSVLKITFEVTSAYANTGLSMGYSCSQLQELHPGSDCQDKSYSFVGKWSDEGKLILVFVMLYGRLKKFTMESGKAWKLRVS
ncbi:cation transporter HKT2;2-like isoform X2 [Typha latifolia]|uniref:cation transporter HKT2;2-like isoform X2 n=1 Tax=Typha latifolia TaxID=4733 RepID=UPI003C2EB2C7